MPRLSDPGSSQPGDVRGVWNATRRRKDANSLPALRQEGNERLRALPALRPRTAAGSFASAHGGGRAGPSGLRPCIRSHRPRRTPAVLPNRERLPLIQNIVITPAPSNAEAPVRQERDSLARAVVQSSARGSGEAPTAESGPGEPAGASSAPPAAAGAATAGGTPSPTPSASPTVTATDTTAPTATATATPTLLTHTLLEGQFPSTVATLYGVKLSDLMAANELTETDAKTLGSRICPRSSGCVRGDAHTDADTTDDADGGAVPDGGRRRSDADRHAGGITREGRGPGGRFIWLRDGSGI